VGDVRTELEQTQTQAIAELRNEVAELRTDRRAVLRAIRLAPALSPIGLVQTRVDDIARRQSRIEQSIVNSPERALELPILRNDLTNLRDTNNQRMEAMSARIEQVYDLNKWLLGTMAITIIVLAVSTFLTRKKE